MNLAPISLPSIFMSFIPVLIVIIIFYRWKLAWKEMIYASARMLTQLLLIGYVLAYIFEQNTPWWTLIIVIIMITISSWISLYSVRHLRAQQLKIAFIALSLGATPVLLLVTGVVIPHDPWYKPSFIIPIAGMIYYNAMNAIGLAAERFASERANSSLLASKQKALKAALIPQINSFLAVGLVSLPGMMTGQILSGIDPLIAVRYQIVVMTMVLGAGGVSSALYLNQQT